MAVVVRLRRMGNRNNAFYRVVAADSRTPTDGKFIERLGWYNPNLAGINFSLDLDRVDYWKQNGAQFTGTVKSLVKKARAVPAEPAAEAKAAAPAPAPEPDVEEPVAEEAPAEVAAEEPTEVEATKED